MSAVAHWDEVEGRRHEAGHLCATWTDLGIAAGSVLAGVQRIQIEPERWSTPAHEEQFEEEIFYVLGGSGLSWQEGSVYEVGTGDCLVHLAQEGTHTLRAGPGGLDVLAFGQRAYSTSTRLPRAGVSWLGMTWVASGEGGHPWEREAAAGEPELGEAAPRPRAIVNVADVEPAPWGQGGRVRSERRNLGVAAGSVRTGLQHVTVAPGRQSAPKHCHSAEEEIFVLLDGEGEVALGDERHPVRPGSIVARPPGTRVAHAFHAGEAGLTFLAYGTREPNDMAYYPDSGKVSLRGIGVIFRPDRLDYWDGET